MKILHTSDLHLSVEHPERFEALEEILEKSGEHGIDIITISGDLFDSGIIPVSVKKKFIETIERYNRKVVLIPGNHDKDAFGTRPFLGSDVKIILNPMQPIIFTDDKTAIWGLPYKEGDPLPVLIKVMEKAKKYGDYTHILMFHGDLLELVWDTETTGNEGTKRYMPVSLSYFNESPFKFILAGHYHTNTYTFPIDNRGYFIYPGTPVSITSRETGRRRTIIVDTGSGDITQLPLDTFHFNTIEVVLKPEADPIEIVEKHLDLIHPGARNTVKIRGFFRTKNEEELVEKIRNIIDVRGESCEIDFQAVNVENLLRDTIIQRILGKLEGMDDEKREELRTFLFEAIVDKFEVR